MINPDASKWRGLRESLLEREYGRSSAYLAGFYITKARYPHREVVYQRAYAKIIDKGPVITADHGNKDEIRAMLELARLKQWRAIQFDGTAQFKRDAMRSALLSGFEVATKTTQDAALLQRVREEMAPPVDGGQRTRMRAPSPFRG